MFKRNPRAIKDIMEQLNPGEQFYLDLAGNIRKGPSTRNRNCYCAPVFAKFEKRLEKDHRDLVRAIGKFIFLFELSPIDGQRSTSF